MESDNMDIIKNYSNKFNEKLPEQSPEKDIVGTQHVGDNEEDGGGDKVSSLSQVQQPTLSDMFTMMTAMQSKLEALQNVGGPRRGPKENFRVHQRSWSWLLILLASTQSTRRGRDQARPKIYSGSQQ